LEKDGSEQQEECDFVELRGVAGDAVAEIDGPGEICRGAVGVVGETCEETSDAAEGDAEGEGDGVEIAGGGAESDVALDEFDGEEAEGEGSDDGFASDEVGGVVEILPGQAWVFEPEQELRTQGGASDRGRDDGPTERRLDGISETAAQGEVDKERCDVGESFEEEMRMDGVGAEVEVVREGDELGGCEDGEL